MFTVNIRYLDGAASIGGLVSKAKNDGMGALALTDHGNMFGIKDFHETCKKNDIKPILGVETYVASRGIQFKDKHEKEDRSGDHLILLAKNRKGYRNLLKLVTIANTEGMYYKPRIDKALLEKYSEGLIVSSACLGGEIPQLIMKGDLVSELTKQSDGINPYLERIFTWRHNDILLQILNFRKEVYDKQVEA